MAKDPVATKVVYTALAGNLAIAIIKFVAGGFTGSSAMLSEGVHSLVDTTNQLLLLYGMRRARKPPDISHPFGYGRELYFWSFIIALLVMSLGSGVSLYEGISHVLAPEPMRNVAVNYLVLAGSAACEGTSWWIGLKAFQAAKGRMGYMEAFRASKDPTTFTVLFEDSAALVGLALAAAGIAAADGLSAPEFDGVASIAIGLLLMATSLLLARETKALLIGEAAHPKVRDSILRIAGDDCAIQNANGVLTIQMGPEDVIAALSAEFEDGLSTTDIEACIGRMEAKARDANPDLTILFVKPQSAEVWQRRFNALVQ